MKRLWILFGLVLVVSFAVLGWIGGRIYQEAPPIADKVVTTEGQVVVDAGEIQAGQNVWQSLGGMEVGSIWGHGSYVAPDWTADLLHREAAFILDRWANDEFSADYEDLDSERQAQLSGRLAKRMRTNTFDPATSTITMDPIRAEAFQANLAHYSEVFSNGNSDYAIPAGAVSDSTRLKQLPSFFFWSAWAASTNRPADDIAYTHNWPYEPLVGNRATGESVVWTGVSIINVAGRNLGDGLVVCISPQRRGRASRTRIRSARPLGSHTVPKGNHQILLGCLGLGSTTNVTGSCDRALWRGR